MPLVNVMGRVRSGGNNTDLDSTLHEIFGEHIAKHRSCWLHVAAYGYRHEKKITLREVEEIRKLFRHTSPCFSRTFPHRERSKRMTNHDKITCGKRMKLDTGTFEHYMESLWRSFSEDKRTSFAYLDSLWFSLYRKASTRPKVLAWIKQKNIFSKKYVFIPIVCWSHWSLLIFVKLGDSLDSETGTPCMLLLDSLEKANPRRLEPEIRKFVMDIYRTEGRTEDKKAIFRIPFLVPNVPQQKNDDECGSYVLYFLKLFMEAAPENFSISEGYPYFMKRDWFNPESLEDFYEKLQKERPKRKFKTNNSDISLPKPKRGGVISIDD